MYYTDVFVGTGNIEKLKNALKAELKGFNSNDLTQLVQGLCLFMGYPSCLCSLKANVNKSLKDISQKLNEDSEAVQSCLQNKTLTLNCSSCNSNEILCKCCVISCIKELPKKSKCKCVKNTSQSCQCKGTPKKCCKDFLSGLEACLSLLNLKTDLQDCTCDPKTCCKDGTCTAKCDLCDPSKSTITGLGLSRPNPVRLARKLSGMLCGTQKARQCSCGCGSGTPGTSCCCFCHSDCTTKGLSALCSKACPGCSAHNSAECGLKDFCKTLNTIKVLVGSTEMTCCKSGADCHCQLEGSSNCSSSALNCCVVKASSGNDHYQHSVKCMILRVVKFFNGLKPESLSSPDKCSKLCCELICVGKYCDFLRDFYDKGGKDKCGTCNSKGSSGNCLGSTLQSPSNTCCGGASGCQSGDCCLGCQECDAIKFRNALETLKLSSPCGQDLWRVLKDFLNFCNVLGPLANSTVKNAVDAARQKCDTCKSTGGSCQCSPSSGSCKGCTSLLKDSQLKVILAGGYSSSYSSKASWPDCKSKPCCSNPSCNSCTSGSCPVGGCCEKCPKRLCAKIFLGMLPCLYYGLKIVFERCKSENSSQWPGWQTKITEGSIGKFLTAWGIHSYLNPSTHAVVLPVLLGNLFSPNSKGSFDKIYDFVSKEYFVPSRSPSSNSQDPSTTVRSMLLWLYGLRFTSGFHDLVLYCKSLCSPFGNSFHPDAFCYYIHTACFFAPLAIISTIETSDSAQKVFSSSSEFSKFLYPSDPSSLADMLLENVRKVFVPLKFLCLQCENGAAQGGWTSCRFGQGCAVKLQSSSGSGSSSSPSAPCSSCPNSKTYLCTASGSNKDVHGKHCDPNGAGKGKCINANGGSCTQGSDKGHNTSRGKPGQACSNPCPHPLQRFLTATSDSDSKSQSPSSPFRLPSSFARLDFSQSPPVILEASSDNFLTMGFSQGNLSPTAKKGFDLALVLKVFCDDGFYPLTRLLQFVLGVSRHPPESLFELFSFFQKFVSSGVFQHHFASYVEGEPGRPSAQDILNALQNLNGARNSHSGSHPFDLYSLHGCRATKASPPTCGPYLYPLIADAYNIFIENFLGTYLSFVCHLAPTFKTLLEEFKGKFSLCCSSGSCSSIVKCPCAHPFLYSYGFTFMLPEILNKKAQKCSNFIDQLGKVVGKGSPLQKLLDAIDAFLWSIRFPFFFGFLYVWFFVLSYFCYVILIKLDTVHTGSHLHLPRSFKILPSTLFSDASSKLKDLSYFTL